MIVAVMVTPSVTALPKSGPSQVKSELVQFCVNALVVEFHVYDPLAVDSPAAPASPDMADRERAINALIRSA